MDQLNNSCNHIKDGDIKSQVMNQKPSIRQELSDSFGLKYPYVSPCAHFRFYLKKKKRIQMLQVKICGTVVFSF